MIFATRCAGCRTRGPVLCRTCRFALVARPASPAPHGIVVAAAYSGRVRDVMLGLKYRNCRQVALHVAGVLAQRLAATGGVDVDVVTWAPTSTARRRRRGFDQAEMLARAVAAHLGLPCRAPPRARRNDPGADGTGPARAPLGTPLPCPPACRRPARPRRRRRRHHRCHARLGTALAAPGGAADVVLAAVAATPDCLLPARRAA